MALYVMEVCYDGLAFNGSQLQGAQPTVQLALNQALATVLREPVVTFGASRTDASVHALSNFYHFNTEQLINPTVAYSINSVLPPTLAVKKIYTAAPSFNARFHALSRTYRYRVYRHKDPFLYHRAYYYPYTLNDDALHVTAAMIGRCTDFTSFSKRNTQSATSVCSIFESYWERSGAELHYLVTANRFLRGMVRGLVGTQLLIARGHGTTADMERIIAVRNCTSASFGVPGYGLYLEAIAYPPGTLIEI